MTSVHWWRGLLISLIACCLLLFGAVRLADALGRRTERDSAAILRDAVARAALTCYAIEGRYPQSLSYLEDNYDLSYDRSQFVVRYDAFASNVLPDISVSPRGD